MQRQVEEEPSRWSPFIRFGIAWPEIMFPPHFPPAKLQDFARAEGQRLAATKRILALPEGQDVTMKRAKSFVALESLTVVQENTCLSTDHIRI